MPKVAVIAKNRTKPGKRDELRKLFEKHLGQHALSNRTQEVVVWCDDIKDSDAFYLFEICNSYEAFQLNSAAPGPWFADYMREAGPLLDGQPEMMVGTPKWAKGVQT